MIIVIQFLAENGSTPDRVLQSTNRPSVNTLCRLVSYSIATSWYTGPGCVPRLRGLECRDCIWETNTILICGISFVLLCGLRPEHIIVTIGCFISYMTLGYFLVCSHHVFILICFDHTFGDCFIIMSCLIKLGLARFFDIIQNWEPLARCDMIFCAIIISGALGLKEWVHAYSFRVFRGLLRILVNLEVEKEFDRVF